MVRKGIFSAALSTLWLIAACAALCSGLALTVGP